MDIYSISIKQQEPHDLPAICRLIEEAFATVQESDHREQFLVKRLLSSPGFIPELSLTALIEEAHKRAAELNYKTVLVLGHKDYYPRFGYRRAEDFGIIFPFGVPPEFCMVKELTAGAASLAAGQVKYPKAFFEY